MDTDVKSPSNVFTSVGQLIISGDSIFVGGQFDNDPFYIAKYTISDRTWNALGVSVESANANSITIGEAQPLKAKCEYCGHWEEPYSECTHCGAPVNEAGL